MRLCKKTILHIFKLLRNTFGEIFTFLMDEKIFSFDGKGFDKKFVIMYKVV